MMEMEEEGEEGGEEDDEAEEDMEDEGEEDMEDEGEEDDQGIKRRVPKFTLTEEEEEKIEEQAEEELNTYVQRFTELLQAMIDNGAKPDFLVDKLKKYRPQPLKEDKPTPAVEEKKDEMIPEENKEETEEKKDVMVSEEKEDEEKSSSGLRGGARTRQTARKSWIGRMGMPRGRRSYGRQGRGESEGENDYGGEPALGESFWSGIQDDTTDKKKKLREYGPHGLQSLLHLATDYPHPILVKYLLDLNPDHINAQDDRKRTPLNLCVGKLGTGSLTYKVKSADILEILLNRKADPNIPDEYHNHPVYVAASQDKYEFIRLLRKYNANLNVVNNFGDTPLIHAVQSHNYEVVEELLAAGADANFKDHKNRTALHHAVNSSTTSADASFEMENLLLRAGADINAVDVRGRTPLHYAFIKIGSPTDKSHIDPIETVTSLCGVKNCKVDVKDNWGATPMHYAAQRGSHICALSLLNKKADIETKDIDGNTPLAIALLAGHSNIAIMLIQSKANVLNKVHVVKRKMMEDKDKEVTKGANMDVEEVKAKKEKKAPKIKSQEEIAGEMIGEPVEEEEDHDDMEIEKDGSDNGTEDENEDDEDNEDEDEDEDDDDGYDHGYRTRYAKRSKGFYGSGRFGQQKRGSNSNKFFVLDNSLKEGTYSMFCIAIRKGWQGVAYLMLQNNFPLMNALQDALNEEKFMYVRTLLTKVEDPGVVRNVNEEGQNLFHTFSMKGSRADNHLTVKIFKELVHFGVNLKAIDKNGRTPLHYACESKFKFMIDELLKAGVDPNIQDQDGHTGFSLLLVGDGINKEITENFVKYGADLKKKFKLKTKHREVRIGPLAYLCQKGSKDFELYNLLLKNGVSINDADEDGLSALMYAIKENSKKMVKFFVEHPDIDKNMADKSGKTPVHYVVNPLEYGSYENITILEMVAKVFDVNARDKLDRAPIFYAHLQDSGRMVEKLKELGATDQKPGIQRQATSIINAMGWPEQEINAEEDAEKFIKEKQAELEKKEAEKPTVIPVDDNVNNAENCEVVVDPKLGPYDLIMTKVDIRRGGWSENLFYKMQVLHEKNRNVYILFTRWGRIGEEGAYQQTPFATKEECIENFCKIFKDKSGNLWENKDKFEKVKRKYQLLKFEKRVNHKEFLKPFDLKDPSIPKTSLNKEVRHLMEGITSVKIFQRAFDQYEIDREYLPLEQLSKSILSEAKVILYQISQMITEVEKLQNENKGTENLDEILRIREEIADKSSRYYELIPNSQYKNTAIPPINDAHSLKEHTDMIDSLLDIEIALKTILGAHYRKKEIHPLEYCYSALNVKMMPLEKESPEFQVLRHYVKSGHNGFDENFIMNIFAVERKGEAERFAQWKDLKNHMLLWHGSRVSNFMGILSQGLRIAPPEAPATGYMFGKGVYFADVFDKSFGYTDEYTPDDGKSYALLLLCEVALGEMKELKKAEYITELKAPYKSVKGVGRVGPKLKQGIVLSNGAVVPCGDVVENKKTNKNDDIYYWDRLQYNEYIVYDVSQIRIRYVVQVRK